MLLIGQTKELKCSEDNDMHKIILTSSDLRIVTVGK